jgi:hypothetical protein
MLNRKFSMVADSAGLADSVYVRKDVTAIDAWEEVQFG